MSEEHISLADLARHFEYEMEVSALAYRYYEEEERPEGRAKEHWMRAEKEVQRRKTGSDGATPGALEGY